MTKRLYVIFTAFSLIINMVTAQTPTPEEKTKCIASLDSTDANLVAGALQDIEKYQITEAISKLESNIWKQQPDFQYFFLRTMWKLHSTNTLSYVRAFIDSTNTTRFKKTYHLQILLWQRSTLPKSLLI